MKKLLATALLCIITFFYADAQTLTGTVQDSKTDETLVMVNILGPERRGTVTNNDGFFTLQLAEGTSKIQVSFIGYEAQEMEVSLKKGETKNIAIKLVPRNEVLETVVISAGKFEQRVEETTVSLEVIKPNIVVEKNTISLEDAFQQVPGVAVLDDQVNIRSGSGWSFGAGSRVLMMVDDMPLMSPDASQIQWKLLPNEAIYQMEVIKGAASALYGTSAMGGLINVRTASPKLEPYTEVALFGGTYDKPKRKELVWWDSPQKLGGFTFIHARKVGTADVTLSGNFTRDEGFRYQEIDDRNRINIKTQFYPEKVKGLTWGINTSVLYAETGNALLWYDYNNAYISRDSSTTLSSGWDYYIDPFVSYRHGRGKHTLRGRYMGINNNAANKETNYANNSTYYYSEYQYQHFLSDDLWVTAGAVGALGYSQSEVFAGYHESANGAGFIQVDKKFNRLSVSGGFRYEAFRLDDRTFSKPVFRAGVNYKVAEATFLRASYGGGYRFPSMAEVYTSTNVGSTGVYPNHELLPESGWSAEIGIKQGFQVSDTWKGLFDFSAFINHFDNMTEFSFGFWGDSPNPFNNIGFKSLNVGPTEITGFEATVTSQGKIGPVSLRLLTGYAFMNPITLDPNYVYATYIKSGGGSEDVSYESTSSNPANNVLKYRYKQLFRFDVQLEYKGFGLGTSIRYNDYMQNIDKVFEESLGTFELFPGVKESRQINPDGDLVFDMRAYYDISTSWRVSFIVDNLTNREVVQRPSQLGPPRKYTVQVKFSL